MAGGKGRRLRSGLEKPLAKIGGITMLERVISAVRDARGVRNIIVACTSNTPRTANKARKLGVEFIMTPGRGYVSDLRFAIRKLKLRETLVVGADLPFINSRIIEQMIGAFRRSAKPALTATVRRQDFARLGFKPRYALRFGKETLVPVGLNVVDGLRLGRGELDQVIIRINEAEYLVNINSRQEMEIARRMSGRVNPRSTVNLVWAAR